MPKKRLGAGLSLTSDANGSLTNDGARTFAYDAENQLTIITVAGSWKSDFTYDGLNRRRIERDYSWSGSTWAPTNEIRYIYDGYLLLQERNSNNAVMVTYTRGIDMSGSVHGIGGIGGLLARTDANGSTFYHADGSGNITALINGSQNFVARYLYNPFGQVIGKWGALADANEMQFSSMPHHNLSGVSLYAFRGYDPGLQRWLNQDPIQENGGINLYGFVGNAPIQFVDPFGLSLSDGAGGFLNAEIFGPQQFANNILIPALGWVNNQIDNMRNSENPVIRGAGGGLWGLSMVWGGPELKPLNEVRDLEKTAKLKQLDLPLTPARPGDRGKTSGVLCDKKGNQFSLISGKNGPAQNAPKGPGSGFDLLTSTHVEGHAAALMDQLGINDATLYINNPEICPNCSRNLPSMLPPGSSLTIILPNGTTAVFTGK